REHVPSRRWPSSTATKFTIAFLKSSKTVSIVALLSVAIRWLTSVRKSIDSARTGGRRSRGTGEAFSWDCAVACTNILLTDLDSQGVLQINDRHGGQTNINFHPTCEPRLTTRTRANHKNSRAH